MLRATNKCHLRTIGAGLLCGAVFALGCDEESKCRWEPPLIEVPTNAGSRTATIIGVEPGTLISAKSDQPYAQATVTEDGVSVTCTELGIAYISVEPAPCGEQHNLKVDCTPGHAAGTGSTTATSNEPGTDDGTCGDPATSGASSGDPATDDGTTGDPGTTGGASDGVASDPENDCVDTNSEDADCFPLSDVLSVTTLCEGPELVVVLTTVAGFDAANPDATIRAGCTISGSDPADSFQHRCIWRMDDPLTNEFPPDVNGSDVTLDAGEGCVVVGDELHMVLAADKVPFAPVTATCSTAHSTGPGTTLNDFVPTFDYNPSCGQ